MEERKVGPDRLVDSHPVDHEALPVTSRLAPVLVNHGPVSYRAG